MSETSKLNNPVAAYEVLQEENNKLKLIEGRYALSTKELRNIDGMILTTSNYKIVKDEKTGKILRVQDNQILSEMNKAKYDRLLKQQRENEEQGR